jgi:hypothetical protein
VLRVNDCLTDGQPVSPAPVVSQIVIGGIDTHKDLHVAAVLDLGESVLATRSFSTTRAGYRALVRWMRGFGDVRPLAPAPFAAPRFVVAPNPHGQLQRAAIGLE